MFTVSNAKEMTPSPRFPRISGMEQTSGTERETPEERQAMSTKPTNGLEIPCVANRDTARPTPWARLKPTMKRLGARIKIFSVGTIVLVSGLVLLVFSLRFFDGPSDVASTSEIPSYLAYFALCLVWHSRECFVDALQGKSERPLITVIGPVVSPVVSPKEFLLRPSQLPPSHQQAELLRATVHGQDTHPEELLRAAYRNRVHEYE